MSECESVSLSVFLNRNWSEKLKRSHGISERQEFFTGFTITISGREAEGFEDYYSTWNVKFSNDTTLCSGAYPARSLVTPTLKYTVLTFLWAVLHRRSWRARKRYLLACNESYGSAIKDPGIPDVLIILCRDSDTEFRSVLLPASMPVHRRLNFRKGKDKLIFSGAE